MNVASAYFPPLLEAETAEGSEGLREGSPGRREERRARRVEVRGQGLREEGSFTRGPGATSGPAEGPGPQAWGGGEQSGREKHCRVTAEIQPGRLPTAAPGGTGFSLGRKSDLHLRATCLRPREVIPDSFILDFCKLCQTGKYGFHFFGTALFNPFKAGC